MQKLIMPFFWLALCFIVVCFSIRVYAEITKTDTIIAPVSDLNVEKVSIPPVTENTPLISNLIYDKNSNNISNNNSNTLHSNVPVIVGPQGSKRGTGGTRITQGELEHVKQGNGSMYAIDIVGDGNSYFPDRYKEYFVVHIGKDERLGDYIIIRNDKERWVYGHTQTTRQAGDSIHTEKDGKVLGQYNKSGMSQGPHTHIERWTCPTKESKMKDCQNVSSEGTVASRNRQLIEQRGWGEARTIEKVTESKTEVRCTADAAVEEINYAYQLGGIDFVGTIAAESKFDPACKGDSGHSFGYCQIHDTWNKATQMDYRKLTTNKEKLDFCYKIYKGYLDKGNIQNRLYGYNVRFTKGLPKLNIQCK